jgi:rSAM/selenodomain-associated transferase 2
VIPTLEAARLLPACLSALVPALVSGLVREAIVVDGGSRDLTPAIARDFGCALIASSPGRARQMNAGAAAAKGAWLLFLHADTVLEAGWEVEAAEHLHARPDKAAAFTLAFDDEGAAARRVAALANWRARTFGLPYGDQGLFLPRALFDAVGGFPDQPLMEDVAIVRAIGRGRLTHLSALATTSGERHRRDGWIRRPLRNLAILAAHLAGVQPARLRRWYS